MIIFFLDSSRTDPRTPLSILLGKEEIEGVYKAIDSLSSEDQKNVLLSYMRGMELSEIAQELGIPINTVRSRLTRGKKFLLEQLGENGEKIIERYFSRNIRK